MFRKKMTKKMILPALYMALSVMFFCDPYTISRATDFDGTFSEALVKGLDFSYRISGAYFKLLILFPMLILLFVFLGSIFVNSKNEIIQFLNEISAFLFIPLIISYYDKYSKAGFNLLNSWFVLIGFAIVSAIMLIPFIYCKAAETINITKDYPLYIEGGLTVAIIVATLARGTIVYLLPKLLWFAVLCTMLVLPYAVKRLGNIVAPRLIHSLSYFAGIYYILCEGAYILLGRKLISNVDEILLLIIAIAVTAVLFIAFKNIQSGLIVSYGLCAFAANYQMLYGYGDTKNLFELGNTSSAILTWKFGRLPIAEYFSAHLLSDGLSTGIYYLLNGDEKGFCANPYLGLISFVELLILYELLKRLFCKDKAFLIILFLPMLIGEVKWSGICLLSVLALFNLIKKNTVRSYFAFWIVLALMLCYRLDDGLGLGLGAILTVVLLSCFKKNELNIRNFILSFLATAFVFALAFIVYLVAKGINPLQRIMEFIAVSAKSNSTWALAQIGEMSAGYFIVYLALPVMAVIIFIMTLVSVRDIDSLSINSFAAVIAISVCIFLYISRTLVLHTYGNDPVSSVLLNYYPLQVLAYCAFYCSTKKRNDGYIVGSALFMTILFIWGLSVSGVMPTADSSLVSKAIGKAVYKQADISSSQTAGERIVYDEETDNGINAVKGLLDALLTEEESFIDFANASGLFALTGREQLAYVCQTPSLLTDDYSQGLYLQSLIDNKERLPIMLTAKENLPYEGKIAGMNLAYRYYKVSEYLFANYRPLTCIGNFVVWASADRFDELSMKNLYQACDFDYNEDGEIHYYELGMTSLLWADSEAEAGTRLHVETCTNEDGTIAFMPDNLGRASLLNLTISENASNQVGKVRFVDAMGNILATFTFDLIIGDEKYAIRISADPYWYSEKLDHMVLELPQNEKLLECYIDDANDY